MPHATWAACFCSAFSSASLCFNPLCPYCCCVFIYGINIVKVPSDSPAFLPSIPIPAPVSALSSSHSASSLAWLIADLLAHLVSFLLLFLLFYLLLFLLLLLLLLCYTHTYTHICTLHCHEQSQRLFGNCLTVVPCACASACCSNRFLATVPASYIHPPTIHTSSPSLLSLPLSVLSSSSPLLCPVLFSVLFCCYCCTVGNL